MTDHYEASQDDSRQRWDIDAPPSHQLGPEPLPYVTQKQHDLLGELGWGIDRKWDQYYQDHGSRVHYLTPEPDGTWIHSEGGAGDFAEYKARHPDFGSAMNAVIDVNNGKKLWEDARYRKTSAAPMRYFHVTDRANNAGIYQQGLRSADDLYSEDNGGDAAHVWFRGENSVPNMGPSHSVWELTHPHLYDMEEDSNFENGATAPYYKIRGGVRPEHLKRMAAFFHGTHHTFNPGDMVQPGHPSNYDPDPMDHVYFTSTLDRAHMWAEDAADMPHPLDWEDNPQVYEVEPTGEYEYDPHGEDYKSPVPRDFRSRHPLRVIRRVAAADDDIEREMRELEEEQFLPRKPKFDPHIELDDQCLALKLQAPALHDRFCPIHKMAAESQEPAWMKDYSPEHTLEGISPERGIRRGDPAAGENWWEADEGKPDLQAEAARRRGYILPDDYHPEMNEHERQNQYLRDVGDYDSPYEAYSYTGLDPAWGEHGPHPGYSDDEALNIIKRSGPFYHGSDTPGLTSIDWRNGRANSSTGMSGYRNFFTNDKNFAKRFYGRYIYQVEPSNWDDVEPDPYGGMMGSAGTGHPSMGHAAEAADNGGHLSMQAYSPLNVLSVEDTGIQHEAAYDPVREQWLYHEPPEPKFNEYGERVKDWYDNYVDPFNDVWLGDYGESRPPSAKNWGGTRGQRLVSEREEVPVGEPASEAEPDDNWESEDNSFRARRELNEGRGSKAYRWLPVLPVPFQHEAALAERKDDTDWSRFYEDHRPYYRHDHPKLYHGTSMHFEPGDYIEPGHHTQFPGAYEGDYYLGYVHATPSLEDAWKYADNAYHAQPPGAGLKRHVYEVKPTGYTMQGDETFPEDFESDEDMFQHGAHMSKSPFKVVREVPYDGEPLPFSEAHLDSWGQDDRDEIGHPINVEPIRREAMPRDDAYLSGLQYRHFPPDGKNLLYHSLRAFEPGTPEDEIYDNAHGYLNWLPNGRIMNIGVYDSPNRRRGLATELLRRAKQIQPNLHHSLSVTDKGRSMINGLGDIPGGPVLQHESAAGDWRELGLEEQRRVEREMNALHPTRRHHAPGSYPAGYVHWTDSDFPITKEDQWNGLDQPMVGFRGSDASPHFEDLNAGRSVWESNENDPVCSTCYDKYDRIVPESDHGAVWHDFRPLLPEPGERRFAARGSIEPTEPEGFGHLRSNGWNVEYRDRLGMHRADRTLPNGATQYIYRNPFHQKWELHTNEPNGDSFTSSYHSSIEDAHEKAERVARAVQVPEEHGEFSPDRLVNEMVDFVPETRTLFDRLSSNWWEDPKQARWQQGDCLAYAVALRRLDPSLRFGTAGYNEEGAEEGDDVGWWPVHHFAHDDTHYYDSLGRHPLELLSQPSADPHKGLRDKPYDHIDLNDDENYWGYKDQDWTEDDINAAAEHAIKHGVLNKTAAQEPQYTRVYRVEHEATGQGPYRGIGYQHLGKMMDAHANSPDHPLAMEDGIGKGRSFIMDKLHGFGSMDDLNRWFDGFQGDLHNAGFGVSEYDVDQRHVYRGGRQLAFTEDPEGKGWVKFIRHVKFPDLEQQPEIEKESYVHRPSRRGDWFEVNEPEEQIEKEAGFNEDTGEFEYKIGEPGYPFGDPPPSFNNGSQRQDMARYKVDIPGADTSPMFSFEKTDRTNPCAVCDDIAFWSSIHNNPETPGYHKFVPMDDPYPNGLTMPRRKASSLNAEYPGPGDTPYPADMDKFKAMGWKRVYPGSDHSWYWDDPQTGTAHTADHSGFNRWTLTSTAPEGWGVNAEQLGISPAMAKQMEDALRYRESEHGSPEDVHAKARANSAAFAGFGEGVLSHLNGKQEYPGSSANRTINDYVPAPLPRWDDEEGMRKYNSKIAMPYYWSDPKHIDPDAWKNIDNFSDEDYTLQHQKGKYDHFIQAVKNDTGEHVGLLRWDKDHGLIEEVSVSPNHRGAGIGAWMLDAARNLADESFSKWHKAGMPADMDVIPEPEHSENLQGGSDNWNGVEFVRRDLRDHPDRSPEGYRDWFEGEHGPINKESAWERVGMPLPGDKEFQDRLRPFDELSGPKSFSYRTTDSQGNKVYKKQFFDTHDDVRQRNELFGSLVHRAIGSNAARVVRWPGSPSTMAVEWNDHTRYPDEFDNGDTTDNGPYGILAGLGDTLTAEGDRKNNNWYEDTRRRIPYIYDFGMGQHEPPTSVNALGEVDHFTDPIYSDFAHHFTNVGQGPIGHLVDNPLHPEKDVPRITEALRRLQPDYVDEEVPEWHDELMRRWHEIAAHAKGTESVLEKGGITLPHEQPMEHEAAANPTLGHSAFHHQIVPAMNEWFKSDAGLDYDPNPTAQHYPQMMRNHRYLTFSYPPGQPGEERGIVPWQYSDEHGAYYKAGRSGGRSITHMIKPVLADREGFRTKTDSPYTVKYLYMNNIAGMKPSVHDTLAEAESHARRPRTTVGA